MNKFFVWLLLDLVSSDTDLAFPKVALGDCPMKALVRRINTRCCLCHILSLSTRRPAADRLLVVAMSSLSVGVVARC